MDERTDVRISLATISQLQRPCPFREALHAFVVDSILQDEATGRRAPLPGGAERPPEHPVDSEIEVGVVQHDLCVLSTHLERQALVQPPTGFAHLPSGFGRTGERNDRHIGVIDDGGTGHLAAAVDELDHFRRQAGLQQDFHEHGPGVRHILRGLEHARVPAHQRREHLPGGNRQREVEGRDDAGDADGPPETHRPLAAQFAGHRVAEQAPAFRRGVVRGVDSLLHVPARLSQWLAHFARHQVRDLFLARGQQVAGTSHHVTAQRRRRRPPHLETATRRRDGAGNVIRTG